MVETLTLTSCVAPGLNLPLPGFKLSQLALLADAADQSPLGPQLVSVSVRGAGSACPCVAAKLSDCVLAWIHCGGDCTVRMTSTSTERDPSVKMTRSRYVPRLRCAVETVTRTSCVAPVFNLPLPRFKLSQLESLAMIADQSPAGPQLASVSVCGSGLPCPCVLVKASDAVLTRKHGWGRICWIVKKTFTVIVLDRSLNVTRPAYVPSCRSALVTAIETSWVALAVNVPWVGVTLSQLAPSAVPVDSDQSPELPQLPMVVVCGAGSPCPWVAVNESACELAVIHETCAGGWTVSVIFTVAVLDPSLNVTCPV